MSSGGVRFRDSLRGTGIGDTVACICGKCGLSFVRESAQRSRIWADGCPNREAIERQKRAEKMKRYEAAHKHERNNRRKHASRTSVKWCRVCGGLPGRRPKEGCPPAPRGCGLPYAEEVIKPTEPYRSNAGMCFR